MFSRICLVGERNDNRALNGSILTIGHPCFRSKHFRKQAARDCSAQVMVARQSIFGSPAAKSSPARHNCARLNLFENSTRRQKTWVAAFLLTSSSESAKSTTTPYLTKLGGIPHRNSTKPWPVDGNNKPYTFVAKFCFMDSKDIVSNKIPDDVMLLFFKDAENAYGPDAIHVVHPVFVWVDPVSTIGRRLFKEKEAE